MTSQQKNKIIFKTPKTYNPKVLKFEKRIKKDNPIYFVNNFCNLNGPEKIIIVHKPLKFAANFEPPPFNKILVDFRNSKGYIFLCIAHEYAHILLRNNISIDYSIEQSLAILIQLTYEDSAKIRKFKKKTAEELMRYMNVWEIGRILLKKWSLYRKPTNKRNSEYKNILEWLKGII